VDKKTSRRMAIEYYIDGEILYKRSFDETLLKCMNESKANKALREVHIGIYTTYVNGHVVTRQMQRARYFWMTIEKDCIEFVLKYYKCQVYSDKINAPQRLYSTWYHPSHSQCEE
jgi:hypothetical protein